MYEIRGIKFSFNTTKVVYVAEALGIDYEYKELDLSAKEHKSPEHIARHPFGKAPTLTHDGKHLFESGAICRYLASVAGSDMYPVDDHYTRCQIDQWMDFFTVHLGKHLATVQFERVARAQFGLGEPKQDVIDEALGFIDGQLKALNKHLEGRTYLLGDAVTIADVFAFAYVETSEVSQVSLNDYPNVKAWYEKGKAAPAIKKAKETTLRPAA